VPKHSACRSHFLCDVHTLTVMNTRTSLISERKVWFQYARVWFTYVECNFHTQYDVETHKFDYDTRDCDYNTHKSDIYSQSVILTRMSVIIPFVSVIITLIRVSITLCVSASPYACRNHGFIFVEQNFNHTLHSNNSDQNPSLVIWNFFHRKNFLKKSNKMSELFHGKNSEYILR
jgi:hypothetical protein